MGHQKIQNKWGHDHMARIVPSVDYFSLPHFCSVAIWLPKTLILQPGNLVRCYQRNPLTLVMGTERLKGLR